MPVTSFIAALSSNPYFSAGFGLVGVGASAAIARQLLQHGVAALRRRYVVSIELPQKDFSYGWFLHWMSKNVKHTQHLSLSTTFLRHHSGLLETKFNYIPSVGNHYFKYKNVWLKVERQREKTMGASSSGSGDGMWEAVVLTMLGRNKQLLLDLLQEAREMAMKEEEGFTIIYTPSNHQWKQFGHPRIQRPFDSVILQNDLSDSLHDDVKEFLENPQWYLSRGIPYRRGYLLHGPPGCGKSSFIQALAGRLGFSICILSLSDRRLTDAILNELLVSAPERSFILLEDIDSAFNEESHLRQEENKRQLNQYWNTLTFSGLLNALDGVAAAEGRVLFMTTNHLERLDEALIRPGRVDRIEYLGRANKLQLQEMFKRFYPEDAELFEEKIRLPPFAVNGKVSMAQVQGLFLQAKTNPQAALEMLNELLHVCRPAEEDRVEQVGVEEMVNHLKKE
eukprot:TRINITY_DN13556_c0_g1_i1.p1 TRINITY_DN13556_c0_g1~~TRINITY_DN13556_c0_g1_i1.p1  ORF type:complete len:476 (-),score=94.03 TRINITY_DN13556_c0_g1_i1:367-1719(-)